MIIINEETDFIYKYKLKDKHLRKLESFFTQLSHSVIQPLTCLPSLFLIFSFLKKKVCLWSH